VISKKIDFLEDKKMCQKIEIILW